MLPSTILRLLPFLRRLFWGMITYLNVQLFITLFSWPLYLYWGLPISAPGILGNLIFAPFLTAFLLLSSLIFFCELLHIPSTPCIMLLEWISHSWITLMTFSTRSWLSTFPQPPMIIALLIPVGACIVLHHKKLISPVKKSIAFMMLIIITSMILRACSSTEKVGTIPCFGKELILIQSPEQRILIDPGCIGRRISAPSFVRFTLIPTLMKKGILHLDSIVIAQPSTMAFKATAVLIDTIEVTELFIPAWQGRLKKSGWAAWEQLLATCKKWGTALHKIDTTTMLDAGTIKIVPDTQLTKKNGFLYHALRVEY